MEKSSGRYKDKGGPALFVILLLIAILLGFQIYYKYSSPAPQKASAIAPQVSIAPQKAGDPLAFPTPGDKEGITKHHELLSTLAKTSDTLDVTDCRPNPQILRIKSDDALTIVNKGSADITLANGENVYSIKANTTNKIPDMKFTHGPGDYGYSCNKTPIAGVFFVE